MSCPFTPSQLRALSKPDAIEDAIAAIIADRIEAMRDRQRHDEHKEAEREQARKVLRRYEPWVLSVAMFVSVLGCSWIAELRMDGAW